MRPLLCWEIFNLSGWWHPQDSDEQLPSEYGQSAGDSRVGLEDSRNSGHDQSTENQQGILPQLCKGSATVHP